MQKKMYKKQYSPASIHMREPEPDYVLKKIQKIEKNNKKRLHLLR